VHAGEISARSVPAPEEARTSSSKATRSREWTENRRASPSTSKKYPFFFPPIASRRALSSMESGESSGMAIER